MDEQPHVPHTPRSRGVLIARNKLGALCRNGAPPAAIEAARQRLRYEMAAAQVAQWLADRALTDDHRALLAAQLAGGDHVAA